MEAFIVGKEEIYLKYTPYEMSTIIERLNALNTITAAKDYGTGEKMHTVEVHILSWIAENPGISVTDVALAWNRTKGAVSQIIRKLEEKGMVERKNPPDNKKTVCLYVTEKGAELDRAHREYDSRNYVAFLKMVEKYFEPEEIEKAFEFMEIWTELSMQWEPS
ncbi:hypothetical protein K280104A7_20290 [Candidatus Bariatricus faecipullorum]